MCSASSWMNKVELGLVDQRVTDLAGLVSMVDVRSGSREAVFGNINLRSKADYDNFMAKHFPSGTWSWFYDVDVLLSKLPKKFTTDIENVNLIHNLKKIQWTKNEANIALSFKNEIPSVIGDSSINTGSVLIFTLSSI